jgi:hypothetical protein
MAERTENEKAAAAFDVQLTAVMKSAKKRNEQLWPGVVGQLEMAQHRVREMMHPDDR